MTPLLILTHGEHGAAMLKAAEGMLGAQQQVLALSLGPDETREAFAERAAQAMSALSSMPLALVDVACGTPWNVAVLAGCAMRSDVLAGLSLPLLLEALTLRESLGPVELAAELKKRAPQVLQRAVELLPAPAKAPDVPGPGAGG